MCAFRGPRGMRDTAGLRLLLTSVSRPNPLVIGWRWRYELAGCCGLAAALHALAVSAGIAGLIGAVATTVAFAALIALFPPARRVAAARAWCIISPHRIRTGCAQAFVHSRDGKIPVVLVTRAQPFGERVLVWCRAGTSPQDLESAREQLAVACWAREVKITRNAQFAHLVTVEVIRRVDQVAQASVGPLRALPEQPPPTWQRRGPDEHSDAA